MWKIQSELRAGGRSRQTLSHRLSRKEMTASRQESSTTTTRIQPTKISDLRPGWIGDAYFRALVEVKSSDLEEESSTTTVKKAQQQQQQQKEFLVGDASAKITFRCSDKREGLFLSRVLFLFSSSLRLSSYRRALVLVTFRTSFWKCDRLTQTESVRGV